MRRRKPLFHILSILVLLLLAVLGAVGWWLSGDPLFAVLAGMMALLVLVQIQIYRRLVEVLSSLPRLREALIPQVQALLQLDRLTGGGGQSLPPLGGAAMSPDAAALLAKLVLQIEPRRVLELGSGTSTVLVAHLLHSRGEGRILSLDHDSDYAEATRTELRLRGLEGAAHVVHAPLTELDLPDCRGPWYSRAAVPEQSIDLLVIDGPPASSGRAARYPALPVLHSRLADDARVFVDDADRPDERQMVARWLRTYPDLQEEHHPTARGTVILRRRATPPGE